MTESPAEKIMKARHSFERFIEAYRRCESEERRQKELNRARRRGAATTRER